MLLCDTNIFIEVYRSNVTICTELEKIGNNNIAVSDITCGELFYGAVNKTELRLICSDLDKVTVLHINDKISEVAVNLVKKILSVA
jgi:predicted nucleic acid-binding protein